MATAALIPVEEYLATSYRPDCDYIDGEVRERHLGETPHSGLQFFLAGTFFASRGLWGLRGYTEQRVQVAPTRFRIPDVCVLRPTQAPGGILRTPPLLCVEVLSPRDTLASMQERIDDYLGMGVPNIWLVDQLARLAWTADSDGLHLLRAGALTIPETPVRIALAELWAELDDIAAGR